MLSNDIRGLLNGSKTLYEWTGLEQVPLMIDGGGADTGGKNPLPHGNAVWKPGTSTTPALLFFDPIKRLPGQPWDNVYMYNTISRTPPPLMEAFFEIDFAIGQSDLKGNAREFEIELCEAGWTYNMALQYKWSNVDGPPAWRMFDQMAPKNKWQPIPNVPPPSPKAGVFISVQAFFLIDRDAGVTYHDSLIIDGVNYPINIPHKKMLKWSPKSNYLHNAVQIDSMGDGVPGSIQIKNWNVRGIA